jgi:hypothetical protein
MVKIVFWIVRPGVEGKQAGWEGHRIRKSIASVPPSSGEDKFEYPTLDPFTDLRGFHTQQPLFGQRQL